MWKLTHIFAKCLAGTNLALMQVANRQEAKNKESLKCNPSFGAKSAQIVTALEKCPYPASACSAASGISRKLRPNVCPVQTLY